MRLRHAAAALLAGALALGLAAAQKADRPAVVTTLTLFAGTDQGLYRSYNWGLDWARLKDPGLTGLGAVHQVVPLGPRVYAGGEGGLFVSDDFGETWKRLLGGTTVLSVLSSRYPTADPTLFAGTSEGLLRSPDAGINFRLAGQRGVAVTLLEWPGPALVVGTGNGVLISNDGARTFEPAGEGLPEGEVTSLVLSSFFSIDPVLFAAIADQGVYRSPDAGRHWTGAGLAGQTVTGLVWLGPFLYSAGDQGVQRSEDLGKTWTPLNEGLKGVRPRQLLFPLAPAAGSEAFLATDDGVFHTPDGGLHWNGPTLKGRRILCLATFPAPQADPLARRK
jgi:ligand-binding sensor domain-containing protein